MHSRIEQLNKIIGSDALAFGYFQQFNDRAFHNLRLGFYGLSNIIHCDFLFSPDPLPLSVQNCTLSLIADLAGWVSRQRLSNGLLQDCAVNRRGWLAKYRHGTRWREARCAAWNRKLQQSKPTP